MRAKDANLLDLLKKAQQFVVPIYQRVYSWEAAECERLWDDIIRAGSHERLGAHFTGSIVTVEREQGTLTSAEPYLIIDGQQRVTTVSLLLAALAAHLETLPENQQEPLEGFSPKKLRGRYLSNGDEDGDRFFKLILSQTDREALKAIVRQSPITGQSSRVIDSFDLFIAKLSTPEVDILALCKGLRKLVVVDVTLTRGVDDAQLVFEAMNSTGKRLSQADLIRNFILMDLDPSEQNRVYDGYWYPMEQMFAGSADWRFDGFVRTYLTLKTGKIPKFGDTYEAFKEFAIEDSQTAHGAIAVDLSLHASWYAAFALGAELDIDLNRAFSELEQLEATVVYPLILRLYADYKVGSLEKDDFLSMLSTVTSYLFRRTVCAIPTNALNKVFAAMPRVIDAQNPQESLVARLLTLSASSRFPPDEEFSEAIKSRDLYNMRRVNYLLRKLENVGRKEEVSVAEYSIEHILPQNENLREEWRNALGQDWQDVQARLLHTLGNLTLTGYNPEYSDRPFLEKRDMEGGFACSPLKLNQGLGELDVWNAATIEKRAVKLATVAGTIWRRPILSDQVLDEYRVRFAEPRGFDWSVLHDILERLGAGRWTGYVYLAEAVGTSAQAMAGHVMKCTVCASPYRVLTWNGELAEGFAWTDSGDDRDPLAVLESEGVTFIGGRADPERKVETEQLLALLETD